MTAGVVFGEDFGAGDVGGHQVGGELDALKLKVERLRDGFDQQGLGEAGSAGEQAVTTGEEGEQDLLDDVFLSDDGFTEFGGDAITAGLKRGEGGFVSERDIGRGGGIGRRVGVGSHGKVGGWRWVVKGQG